MKILQIIRNIDIGSEGGGAELFAIKLSKALKHQFDAELSICAFYQLGTVQEESWVQKLDHEDVHTFFATSKKKAFNPKDALKGYKLLSKYAQNEEFDVIQGHFYLGGIIAGLLKLSRKCKLAFRTVHINNESADSPYRILIKPLLVNTFFPLSLDGEVGVSKSVCHDLNGRFFTRLNKKSKKVFYIPNGVELNNISDYGNSKKEKTLSKDRFEITSVGRLSTQKGFSYLIYAIKQLEGIVPGIRLEIIGEGEKRHELEELIKSLKLNSVVKLTGLLPHRNVLDKINRSHLFVLPSLWEGLPTVVLEAMATKTPVIATDIPGTRELISNGLTGWLVTAQSTESISESIEFAYRNPDLAYKMTEEAYNQLQEFDINQIAKKYYLLFEEKLKGN